ncbi:DUF4062 domain-containing protein [Streptomyces gardneri]|uniref:DUF4062 domain-containing protein n=1 Tax=Streptomyces gardneri TaxID=66892 RepID=UPI0036BB4414
MQEMVVFIASPGDVAEEREAVRQAVSNINSLFASKTAVRLRATGWEETQPSYGRPQSSINPLVENCDVFIGLLHRKWGTPTGEYGSGFEEEYERAVIRAKESGGPRIAIYFKKVPDDLIEDAGPSLSKVLSFKRTLEQQHTALYKQYSSTSDFLHQITSYLTSVIIEQLDSSENSLPAGTVAKSESAAASNEAPESHIDDEARRQIASTLRGFCNLAERGREDAREELDPDRLLLFSMAAQPEMLPIPIHPLNRIYGKGQQYSLSVMEHRLVLWTLAANIEREKGGMLRSVAPGFRMVAPPDGDYAAHLADELVSQLLRSETDFSVAAGTLYILGEMKARPVDLWPRDEFGLPDAIPMGSSVSTAYESPVAKWVHILETAQVESAALEYIAAVITEPDAALFDVVRERLGDNSAALKLQSLTECTRENFSALAELAATRYVSEGSHFEHLLLSSIPNMTVDQLARVATGRAIPDQVILDALAELSQHRAPSSDEFGKILKGGKSRLIGHSFDVAERCGATSNLLAAISQLKGKNTLEGFEDRVKSLSASEEELSAELANPASYVSAWAALSWRRGPAMADEARQILDSDCANFLKIEELRESGFTENLTDFLKSLLRAAAVELLARIPRSDETAGDLVRFRKELARNDLMSSDPAARALAILGEQQDAETLLARAENSYGEDKVSALRGAVRVGGLDIAMKMVHGKDRESAAIGAQEISSHYSIPLSDLQRLLYSPHGEVRMNAWRAMRSRMDRRDIEEFLGKYRDREEGYYYDVVAAIDRALYLPN